MISISLWLLLAGIVVGGVFGVAFYAGLTFLSQASPPDRRAEAVAAYFTTAYVAISLPVLGIGSVQGFAGLQATSIGFAVLAILVISIALRFCGDCGNNDGSAVQLPSRRKILNGHAASGEHCTVRTNALYVGMFLHGGIYGYYQLDESRIESRCRQSKKSC
jgi:MFS family permease